MNGYLNSLHQIIWYGRNTNSYKFALWRALLDLAADTQRKSLIVPIRDLAPSFLEQYWPLEAHYHLRQGTDPEKDPIIMLAIRKLIREGVVSHGMNLEKFRKKDPDGYKNLLALVEKRAFNHVIGCFHDVRGTDVFPAFFSHSATDGKSGDAIVLHPEGLEFLNAHAELVEQLSISGWVAFTEKISSAPKLFAKLSRKKPTRSSLAPWRETLLELQEAKCFYCGSLEMASSHIDHVLPWSYVMEDRTWNLVMACASCNLAKSNRLPSDEKLELLLSRNQKLLSQSQFGDKKFTRHFLEWKSRDLAAHVRSLHDQARAEQFPIWCHQSG